MAINIYNNPINPQTVNPIVGNIIVDPNVPDSVTPLDIDVLKINPSLPPIDYTNLDFSSIKLQLLNLLKANASNFGYTVRDFADTNTSGMMLNLMAYLGQMVSFHADSMVNELFLDTSQSTWAVNKLLSMYGYKPGRPKAGVILLNIVRNASNSTDATQMTLDNSSQILLSSSSSRKTISFGGESFELFPAKLIDGSLQIDSLGDLIIPPYVSYGNTSDPDYQFIQAQRNTYFCFGLSGTTITENFISNGRPNMAITLGNSPINDSKIIVEVQDQSINIPNQTAYETWNEITYLSLAGFRTNNQINITTDSNLPYLIVPYKLSSSAYAQKQSGYLEVGMLMEIDYNSLASVADYKDFLGLSVNYKLGIISSIDSQFQIDDDTYVDLLLYHPSYTYGLSGTTSSQVFSLAPPLINIVKDINGNSIFWKPGEIVYLCGFDSGFDSTYTQPQLVSESQILNASYQYSGISYLLNHPSDRIAVGRAISETSMALGISADISSSIESDKVYEFSWDGDFNGIVRFGDDTFGKIPPKNSAIRISYRINNPTTTGVIITANQANQNIQVGNIVLNVANNYDSAPSTAGESPATSKALVTNFFSAQDRAVSASDYITLTQKFNINIKSVASISKADADGSTVRLYSLIRRQSTNTGFDSIEPLTLTEKYELRNFLNQYKCLGASIEIVDGIQRLLDLRLDIILQPGYLSGNVKANLTSIISNYFSLSLMSMGKGFDASDFLKTISVVSGIKSLDAYLGGIASTTDSNGNILETGTKIYQQLSDIPGFSDTSISFPPVNNQISTIFGIVNPLKAYEIIVLNSLTINSVG